MLGNVRTDFVEFFLGLDSRDYHKGKVVMEGHLADISLGI
jgi:hypothetical protein